MRNSGNDGERFTARLTPEELLEGGEEAASRDERAEAEARLSEAPRPSKAPRSRVKKPASKSVAPKAPVEAAPVERPSKKAPPKRAKGKAAPKSRRMPAAKQVAASVPPPSAPLSLDPRTTLRDHPGQKAATKVVRDAVASVRRDDEISIPPTSSDPPTDLDDRFFAEGEEAARAHAHAQLDLDSPRVPRHLHVDDDSARAAVIVPPERRKKLANYVKAAVGFSAVLCLAGLVRVGLSRVVHPGVGTERSAAAAQIAVVAPPANPIAIAPAVAAPPPVAAAPAVPVVEEPVAAAPEEPAVPTKSAKEEKEAARAALEHGKRKDAIEAGERSVALDPTDAEAWLILGSAQQDAGKWKDARDSFVACTKQAKVGPIGECRMMLR